MLPKLQPFSFGDDPLNVADSITVQCGVTVGDLPVKLSWKLNNLPLVSSENNINIAQLSRKVTVLTIDPVSETHSGNYTCQAENSAGITSHTAELIVNGIVLLIIFCFTFVKSWLLIAFFFLPTYLIK